MKEVRITLKHKSKKQLDLIFKAEKILREAGFKIDTGYCNKKLPCGQSNGRRDWYIKHNQVEVSNVREKLTPKQEEVLNLIKESKEKETFYTLREMAKKMGNKSVTSASQAVNSLEDKGYIRKINIQLYEIKE